VVPAWGHEPLWPEWPGACSELSGWGCPSVHVSVRGMRSHGLLGSSPLDMTPLGTFSLWGERLSGVMDNGLCRERRVSAGFVLSIDGTGVAAAGCCGGACPAGAISIRAGVGPVRSRGAGCTCSIAVAGWCICHTRCVSCG